MSNIETVYVYNRGENGKPKGNPIGFGRIFADGYLHLKFESMPLGQEITIAPIVDYDLAFNLISQEKFVDLNSDIGGCTGLTPEEFKQERKL